MNSFERQINNNGSSTNDFVSYLNTLHNYHAANSNAYTEKNINNRFYQSVVVKTDIAARIYDVLMNEEPQKIILTGHAGDGKTEIMAQVLKKIDHSISTLERCATYPLANGRECVFIKDFSEYNDESRTQLLRDKFVNCPRNTFVFMIANTGPLINSFEKIFSDNQEKERAKMDLISAMDSNTCELQDIGKYKIRVINLSVIDNSSFAGNFLDKIINSKEWLHCKSCPKKKICYIYSNVRLIKDNFTRVKEYIQYHYFVLSQYGYRLTVRSISEHLAFMITSAKNCAQIDFEDPSYEDSIINFMFFNIFWGYFGVRNLPYNSIQAINVSRKFNFDHKKLHIDEKLFISGQYDDIFSDEIMKIIERAKRRLGDDQGWFFLLRRMYMFLSLSEPEYDEIFSKQLVPYYKATHMKQSVYSSNWTNKFRESIVSALSMIYTNNAQLGKSSNSIVVSQNFTAGLVPTVMLSSGEIYGNLLRITQEKISGSSFFDSSQNNHFRIALRYNGEEIILDNISLPLLDYFDELRAGIISTNIDPQLTHELEKIKAKLCEIVLRNIDNRNSINLIPICDMDPRCGGIAVSFPIDFMKQYSPHHKQSESFITLNNSDITEESDDQEQYKVFIDDIVPKQFDSIYQCEISETQLPNELYRNAVFSPEFSDVMEEESIDKLYYIEYQSNKYRINDWGDLLVAATQFACTSNKELFKSDKVKSVKIVDENEKTELKNCRHLFSSKYIETDYKSNEIIQRIKNLYRELKIDSRSMYLGYRKTEK